MYILKEYSELSTAQIGQCIEWSRSQYSDSWTRKNQREVKKRCFFEKNYRSHQTRPSNMDVSRLFG